MKSRPKIIGVIHLPERLESVEKRLVSLVKEGDRVGIEPSPEDIALYIQSQKTDCPLDHLYKKMKDRDNLHDFPINELIGIRDFHEFYFGIYNLLLRLGAVPIPVGSRVRDTAHVEFIRRYFIDHEDYDVQGSFILNLTEKPHFDHYVASKIRGENLFGVIIGCDHNPISTIVGGEYVDLSGRKSIWWDEAWKQENYRLQEDYLKYKDRLPQL
jgi:hypothetical protein